MKTLEQILHRESPRPSSAPLLKFSLILATIDRTVELSNFLSHLDCQSYRNFELIVVDQNSDDRLVPILTPYYHRFAIQRLRSAKGLSRARNVGLRHISGDIVAFPDDDCWYQAPRLEQIARLFSEHSDWDGVVGKCTARQARHFLDREIGFLDRFNLWGRTVSVAIFLKTSTAKIVGEFDELLGSGSGSGFGGAEEVDYVLRAIEKDCRIRYAPEVIIDHPDIFVIDNDQNIRKAHSYARGMGYALKKHRYPLWYLGYYLLRPLGGVILSLAGLSGPKASYYWALLKGRLSGWRGPQASLHGRKTLANQFQVELPAADSVQLPDVREPLP